MVLVWVQLENAKFQGAHTTGGSTDIFKHFDQLQRDFLIELCRLGGLPLVPFWPTDLFMPGAAIIIPLLGGLGLLTTTPVVFLKVAL